MTTRRVLRGYPDPLEIIATQGACYQKLRARIGLDSANVDDDEVYVTHRSVTDTDEVLRIIATFAILALVGVLFGAVRIGAFQTLPLA